MKFKFVQLQFLLNG